MDPLSWPSHPNAALRERVADYLGRGYQIRSLVEDAAVVTRRNLIARAMQLKFTRSRSSTLAGIATTR
jgi:hypothetical protein